ncbi:MAG: hypothetical protein AVDCRST_MAG64-2546 [uncultured Phycisphaerae bacterium]|uniref:Uncharacterized protein n=1 Tax=uncultured Phycisphaerae bacterium TaxID=904963 RepID=A0A6J4PFR9_9BACT|nr:MAG: hypothetical protein AVDCRST_MAG64-2546 [uncultured Phycisphaerae bacterium]
MTERLRTVRPCWKVWQPLAVSRGRVETPAGKQPINRVNHKWWNHGPRVSPDLGRVRMVVAE